MADVKFLDLDSVESDAPDVVIKHNGVDHKLTHISLQDWIANTKLIQELRAGEADVEKEANVIVTMLTRSFKTLETDVLKTMPLFKLNKILEFARTHDGSAQADKELAAVEAKTAAENPLATVAS